MAFNTFSEIIR